MTLHFCDKHVLVRRAFLTVLLVAGWLFPRAPWAFASEYGKCNIRQVWSRVPCSFACGMVGT
jgi:hypothetical protein